MVQGKKQTKLPPISEIVEKTLLEDVEERGIDFDEISLVEICNKKQGIYGPPSTDGLRRSVQKHWGKIKKRHPKNYVKLLRKYHITPGPFTFHRLRAVSDEEPPVHDEDDGDEQEKNKGEDESKEEAELQIVDDDDKESLVSSPDLSPVLSSSSPPIIEEEIDYKNANLLDDVTKQLGNLAIYSPPRPQATTPMMPTMTSPAQQTPIRKTTFALPASIGSPIPPMNLVGTSTATTSSSSRNRDADDLWYTCVDHAHQEGSKEFPFLIKVNTDYPERNGPGFEVEKMHEVEHNNYLHTAYHIRRSITVPDYKLWEAFVPDLNEYPYLKPLFGRILIVKGTSRPYWFRDASRYHGDEKKIKCEKTKQRHEKTDTAIENDPDRRFHYHLFIFPMGVVLDNSIFSDNNTSVSGKNIALKLDEDDGENKFKKELWGMGVYWRIAEAGRTRIRQDADVIDAGALLF